MKSGAEINKPGKNGYTPLCIAAQNGHKIIVEYLVKEGAKDTPTNKFFKHDVLRLVRDVFKNETDALTGLYNKLRK